MGWLKRIGEIALKGTAIIIGLQPTLKAYADDKTDAKIDRVVSFADKLQAVIVNAEIMGQALSLPGPDKLKAATPAMIQVILSDLVAGRKVKDRAKFEAGVTQVTSGLADIFSSLEDKVETE